MTDPQSGDEARSAQLNASIAVEELIQANNESNRTMLSLVDRVREETAARDRKVDALEKAHRQVRWVIILGAVLVVVLLVLGVINAVNLARSRATSRQVQETNQTLLECVNSTGACGRSNIANQAAILQTVKQYELTVIYCARTNPANVDPNGDKFVACVAKLYPGGPTLNRDGE